jgi:hypothetical protein
MSDLNPEAGLATTEQAVRTAHFLTDQGARAVFLFGSVAQSGEGHDIDMYLMLPEGVSPILGFATHVAMMPGITHGEYRQSRLQLVTQLMKLNAQELEVASGDAVLDLFNLEESLWWETFDLLQAGETDNEDVDPNIREVFHETRGLRQFEPETATFTPPGILRTPPNLKRPPSLLDLFLRLSAAE